VSVTSRQWNNKKKRKKKKGKDNYSACVRVSVLRGQ
jgi:hypothetical protein